jgi:serine/threonine-protein kinase
METAAARSRLPQLTKYEVIEEIGHGGMATVYRARDKRLGREVAIKVIHPHLRDSREVVARFNTEAQAVAKLRHPNIVEVYDVSEPGDGEQYLVVELLRGTTLRKLLQERREMPPEVAAALAIELLGALAHANAHGVVHRDIKPENVLIEHGQQPGTIVKLTDLGIAKLLDAQGVKSTGQVLGSPAHMAPEQIEGGDVDARADVFGLGVLLYECMVGHLPFEGNNPAQVLRRVLDGQYPEAQAERPVVGARWSALLDRALAHTPADRFAGAEAMRLGVVAELERLGVAQPASELDSWMDDAAAYEKAHAARMIEKLCALGAEARKRGEAIGAAAEYNRALAHAPDDPNLLRIVAGLHRAEARGRLLRRTASVLALMVSLGAIAFGVGKFVRTRARHDSVPGSAASAPAAASEPMSPSALSTTFPPSSTAPATGPAPSRSAVLAPPTRPIERSISFNLTPSMGVSISVDGTEVRRGASTGDSIKVDGKAHSLSFTCPVCTSVQREVPAGTRDETLSVQVPIKPATLVIVGASDKTYEVVEHPEIAVRFGNNTLALSRSFEKVTVKEIETSLTRTVKLEAGKTVQAAF